MKASRVRSLTDSDVSTSTRAIRWGQLTVFFGALATVTLVTGHRAVALVAVSTGAAEATDQVTRVSAPDTVSTTAIGDSVCPLPGPPATDPCAPFQQRDCVGSAVDSCLVGVLQVFPGGVETFGCACFNEHDTRASRSGSACD